MAFNKILLAVLACFVIAALAGTEEMVQFAKEYCDKTWYDGNGRRLERGDAFGGDCAHFVTRSIVAGGCLQGLTLDQTLWDYASYTDNGVQYKLICVGGPEHCWINKWVGGLHEYLRDHGWINTLQHPQHWEAVTKACAVLGNPKGDNRGDWAHSAFGIGAPRRVAAHTGDHCDVDVADIFESLQAVWCPPPQCQNCPACAPCEECVGMTCVDRSRARCPDQCTVCDGGACVFTEAARSCNADRCKACQNGQCADLSAQRCPDRCTRCDSSSGGCVPTAEAVQCASDRCKRCLDGACVETDAARQCATDKCKMCKDGECVATDAAVQCAQDKCMKCRDGQCIQTDFAAQCHAENKCMECRDGQCVKTDEAVACEQNACFECRASDGTCVPKENKCGPCERCQAGECKAIECDACNKCDPADSICKPTPDVDCSDLLNNTVCEVAKCDATGKCALRPNADAVGVTACGNETACTESLCAADGSCAVVNKDVGLACSGPATDQCSTAKCDANAQCVVTPLSDIKCTPEASQLTDRNVTLCRDFACKEGICQAVPRAAGTNCTHRVNESDASENICFVSLCDANGMCVTNTTSNACVKRSKSKGHAAVIGAAVGGGVALMAAAIVAVAVATKGAAPLAQGLGFDAPAGVGNTNPTYVQMADTTNPLYDGTVA